MVATFFLLLLTFAYFRKTAKGRKKTGKRTAAKEKRTATKRKEQEKNRKKKDQGPCAFDALGPFVVLLEAWAASAS